MIILPSIVFIPSISLRFFKQTEVLSIIQVYPYGDWFWMFKYYKIMEK